jgi:hypothetical protein
LDRALFRPDSLNPDLVSAIALAGPVLAGLVLFRLAAAIFLLLAIAIGGIAHLALRARRQRLQTSPIIVAIVGVALCGPLASPALAALVALLASGLEVLRSSFWPRSRIHTGVLAYTAVYLGTGGAVAAYTRPGSEQLFPEPIAQWSQFYGGSTHFLEPITLYVGNVAGPVFATSLLAVVIGLAWLWYARRLSLLALLSFLVAGALISLALHYDPVFQLVSGPTWFVVGFALSDRRLLPGNPLARPVLALAAGVIGVGLRAAHLYIEALFVTVAIVELTYSVLVLLLEGGVALLQRRFNARRSLAEKGSASA